MRLWSLNPQYLDAKGLVALWREALLAQKVLAGKTRGYRNHPQLDRFKAHPQPRAALASYLSAVFKEAERRGYTFNPDKIGPKKTTLRIRVTRGQLRYEWQWLCRKLKKRDRARYRVLAGERRIKVHPLFRPVAGGVQNWERTVKIVGGQK